MLCTECHVRKGPNLAQVGFDLAALFHACEINCEIYLDKYGIKRSRKSYYTNICHLYTCIYFHVKIISHYASVKFFLTHTVVSWAKKGSKFP